MNNITITSNRIEGKKNIEFFGKFINIEINYTLDYWNDYFDDVNNRHFFILGRPAIEKDDWLSFDNKPSFITKLIAKDFEKKDIKDFCNKLNGGFSVVIADYNSKQLIIIRDKLGVYPIFFNKKDSIDSFQMSTHQDILAKYTNDNILDEISIAEFLSQGYVMHPNTYYENIKSLDNATYIIYDFNSNLITNKSYFDFQFKENHNYKEVLEKLVNALKKSVEKRTIPQYGNTGVLLSGGGDSRMIVCNAIEKVSAFTIYDVINKEIITTQEITRKLNINHKLIQREEDTNIKGIINSPKFTGGMTTGGHGSWVDLIDNKDINKLDNLLTGDYADWLFKDIAFNTKAKTFLGKKIPLNEFSSFNYNFYGPNIKIEKLLNKIKLRRKLKFTDEIIKNKNKLQIERIIPFSNEYTSSSRLTLQRTNQWESVFIDNDVLDVFLELPYEFKLNGKIYNDALAQLCELTKDIPHANSGVKIGTNYIFSAIIQLLIIGKKKYLTPKKNSIHGENSWGNPKEFILQNKELQNIFYSIPIEIKDYINGILGVDIFKCSIEEIIKIDYHMYYNIITFYCWLKERKKLI